MDWTGRVDTKAAFAFTIESAAIATIVALTANGRLYSSLAGWWTVVLYVVGLGLLLVAAGFAALVVIPRLRRSKVDAEARDNFIYFGHARLWEPADLATALNERPVLPQLARQIVVMARIAWTKHVRVQWSFSLAVVGSACLVTCGLLQAT
ncbi:Pycsar system effector family protein [Cellulomonas sp. McL0617]|uniref:Pycsar system effector family protein n=1 Tax=Cellulomonas sp. McL0617 TaxID=3415675 RepID=UPI003CFAEC63